MPRKSNPAVHTQETLKNVVQDMRDSLAMVEAQLQTMIAKELDEVVVKVGHAEMQRAMQGYATFAEYLKRAVKASRQGRGDFGMTENQEPPKRGRGRPRKAG